VAIQKGVLVGVVAGAIIGTLLGVFFGLPAGSQGTRQKRREFSFVTGATIGIPLLPGAGPQLVRG